MEVDDGRCGGPSAGLFGRYTRSRRALVPAFAVGPDGRRGRRRMATLGGGVRRRAEPAVRRPGAGAGRSAGTPPAGSRPTSSGREPAERCRGRPARRGGAGGGRPHGAGRGRTAGRWPGGCWACRSTGSRTRRPLPRGRRGRRGAGVPGGDRRLAGLPRGEPSATRTPATCCGGPRGGSRRRRLRHPRADLCGGAAPPPGPSPRCERIEAAKAAAEAARATAGAPGAGHRPPRGGRTRRAAARERDAAARRAAAREAVGGRAGRRRPAIGSPAAGTGRGSDRGCGVGDDGTESRRRDLDRGGRGDAPLRLGGYDRRVCRFGRRRDLRPHPERVAAGDGGGEPRVHRRRSCRPAGRHNRGPTSGGSRRRRPLGPPVPRPPRPPPSRMSARHG